MERKAIVYLRVSSTKQVEHGGSLDTQERICLDYADKNGFVVDPADGIFREEGESAKTADRTQLIAMMRYVEKHRSEIEAVIFYRIDRLSRQVSDYHLLKAHFKKYGVQLVSAGEVIVDSPTGRFIETVTAANAQLDNEVRGERAKNGMEDAVRAGRFVWKAPVGFQNVVVAGKKNVAPEEPQAGFVARGFRLVDGGYSATEALAAIDRDGFRQRNGRPVALSLWSKVLHNPLYCGQIKAFGRVTRGNFTPVVDEELFNRVQAVLDGRHVTGTYQKQREDFPLRRFLVCACGKRLTGSNSRGNGGVYAFYRCSKCRGVNHKRDIVEASFRDHLSSRAMDEGLAALLRVAIEENVMAVSADNERRRRDIGRRITELEGEQSHIVRKNIAGTFNDSMAKRLTERAENDIRALRQELATVPRTAEHVEHVVEYGLRVMRDVRGAWDAFALPEKQRFQNLLFPEGVCFANGKFGTTKTALILETKTALRDGEALLVTPGRVELPLQA